MYHLWLSKKNKRRKKGQAIEMLDEAAENRNELTSTLEGDLTITNNKNAKGIVLFAHRSGSSHHSPRNQFVAKSLNNDGLATLLVDLLTPEEEETNIRMHKIQHKILSLILNKFNLKLLSKCLISITDEYWQILELKFLSLNILVPVLSC
jgi:predicted nucleotide-binding protein (sugar kinase/HSP70/actin superfamily)